MKRMMMMMGMMMVMMMMIKFPWRLYYFRGKALHIHGASYAELHRLPVLLSTRRSFIAASGNPQQKKTTKRNMASQKMKPAFSEC